ncbi:DUF2206 domain-containing protein [Candidatus Bathyarchaeota archaeon]|nr:DUF2206 domain-containing protein [Candidatus Bathyarchaeota archaeon]
MSTSNNKSVNFLATILFLELIFCLAIFLDISIVRQVIGFLYLSFVPGYIILKLMANKSNIIEITIFSLGLSIAFLMLIGLIVNISCPSLGISQPLSLIPLTVALNSFITLGAFIAYLKSGKGINLSMVKNVQLPKSTFLLLALPVLSVIGAMWVNMYGNNLILLITIIIISLVFLGVIFKRKSSLDIYPLAIFMISLSLLLHSSLISNYIVPLGSDVSVEYFVFENTQKNAYWNPKNPYFGHIGYGRLHSMLSITILPTIYSTLLEIDPTWVLKIIFPLIFSFVPLGLYQLYKEYIGQKYSFISTFYFMAYETFYAEMLRLNRQMIAELFFILLLFSILSDKIKKPTKTVYFILFSFSLITSHYGLSEIFLFFISLTLISLIIIKRPSKNITVSMTIIFFVIMFAWYIYISSSAVFDSLLNYADYVYDQLDEFLNPRSRGNIVLRGLGLEAPPTVWNATGRAFAYATQLLVMVGFVGLLTKRVETYSRDYSILSSISMIFLGALILVPGLAQTMNMTRFYHILLFFLAPLLVLGAELIVKLTVKRQKKLGCLILLSVVLVPYFLFQTGFVYEITKNQSWSLPLSKYRMNPIFLKIAMKYFDESEVMGAMWIPKYGDLNSSKTYADAPSTSALLNGYGMMIFGVNMGRLSNVTLIPSNSYIYLNKLNTINNIVVTENYLLNTTELNVLNSSNKIYSNGESEIYQLNE